MIAPENVKSILNRIDTWPIDLQVTVVVALVRGNFSLRSNPDVGEWVQKHGLLAHVVAELMIPC